MREFNIAGPVVPADHYLIPPLSRLDLDELLALVRDKKYFVLHAPRQTGKTSALLALRDLLNGRGDYRCVYANVESGQSARENVAEGVRTVLAELAFQAGATLGDGSLRGGVRPPHRLRPLPGANVGGENLPPGAAVRGDADYRLGHVNRGR